MSNCDLILNGERIRFAEYPHGGADYSAAVALRQAVLRTPLGLSYSQVDLASEAAERHFGGFDGDGQLAATLCLQPAGHARWKMRQVAVAPSWQGRGLGAALVRFVERVVGPAEIVLHARESVIGFYEKLGYHAEGPAFLEVTLPHRTMRKCIS